MLEYHFSCKRKTVYWIYKCVYQNLDADDNIWEKVDKTFDTKDEARTYIRTVLYSKEIPYMFNLNNYSISEDMNYIIPESIKHTFVETKKDVKTVHILTDAQYKDMQQHIKEEVKKFTEKKKLQYINKLKGGNI